MQDPDKPDRRLRIGPEFIGMRFALLRLRSGQQRLLSHSEMAGVTVACALPLT
jgi:hypothetical protein